MGYLCVCAEINRCVCVCVPFINNEQKKVIGFKLTGKLQGQATATDLVLTVTEMIRKHGAVGKVRFLFIFIMLPSKLTDQYIHLPLLVCRVLRRRCRPVEPR